MHKNPLKNAENGIKNTLLFKIFRANISPEPSTGTLARVGQIDVRPPPKKNKNF